MCVVPKEAFTLNSPPRLHTYKCGPRLAQVYQAYEQCCAKMKGNCAVWLRCREFWDTKACRISMTVDGFHELTPKQQKAAIANLNLLKKLKKGSELFE